MSRRERVGCDLPDAVLCGPGCGREPRSLVQLGASLWLRHLSHAVSAAEAGCQSEFVRCHLACVPLGVKPTCREDVVMGSATAFKGRRAARGTTALVILQATLRAQRVTEFYPGCTWKHVCHASSTNQNVAKHKNIKECWRNDPRCCYWKYVMNWMSLLAPPQHRNVVLKQKHDYNIEQIMRLMSKQATQLANF